MKRVNTDIAFNQETHLTDQEHRKLKREWAGVYYSSFSSSGQGVAVLIHKKLQFNLINTYSDTAGRYVIVECELNREHITLVNVYGPNHDDPIFFSKLLLRLATIEGNCIFGGDFNLVLDPSKDRSSKNLLNQKQQPF